MFLLLCHKLEPTIKEKVWREGRITVIKKEGLLWYIEEIKAGSL